MRWEFRIYPWIRYLPLQYLSQSKIAKLYNTMTYQCPHPCNHFSGWKTRFSLPCRESIRKSSMRSMYSQDAKLASDMFIIEYTNRHDHKHTFSGDECYADHHLDLCIPCMRAAGTVWKEKLTCIVYSAETASCKTNCSHLIRRGSEPGSRLPELRVAQNGRGSPSFHLAMGATSSLGQGRQCHYSD